MTPTVRVQENLHVLLWLLKDLCWLMEYRVAGLVMVLPTIAVAVLITWQSRADRRDLFHALAVTLWIMANSTWMIGDFFFEERGHGIAQAFFLSGLGLLALFYLVLIPLDRRRARGNVVTRV